jgi:hypothetical protein
MFIVYPVHHYFDVFSGHCTVIPTNADKPKALISIRTIPLRQIQRNHCIRLFINEGLFAEVTSGEQVYIKGPSGGMGRISLNIRFYQLPEVIP